MDVDKFLKTLTGWRREQCSVIVQIIRSSSPDIVEGIKWGNPYFDLNGGFVKLFVAKDWINIYFYKGYLLQSDLFELTASSRMRTVKVLPGGILDEVAFGLLINRASKLSRP